MREAQPSQLQLRAWAGTWSSLKQDHSQGKGGRCRAAVQPPQHRSAALHRCRITCGEPSSRSAARWPSLQCDLASCSLRRSWIERYVDSFPVFRPTQRGFAQSRLAQVFVLIGLPARTLLETCLRSIEELSADDRQGFVLSSGVHVRLADISGHELAPLFAALHDIKERIAAAHPTEADKSELRSETLLGELLLLADIWSRLNQPLLIAGGSERAPALSDNQMWHQVITLTCYGCPELMC